MLLSNQTIERLNLMQGCNIGDIVDFYRRGSLRKNGVVISGDRANNSSSYPVMVSQEKAMCLTLFWHCDDVSYLFLTEEYRF
jgi:hypothetical protein